MTVISCHNMSGDRIDVDIQISGQKYLLYYESNHKLSFNNEHAVATVLIPTMSVEEDVKLSGMIDKRFLGSNERIQEILSTWYPKLRKIHLEDIEGVASDPTDGKKNVGTFFSGGVDSYYTFLKHREEITHLIYVHGFDVPHTNDVLGEKVLERIKYISSEFGVKLVTVKTNLREFLDQYANWEWSHGSAMAAVGHLFARDFSKIYVPSSHSYKDLGPWGSHPILDELWSSENIIFDHDGCESTRNLKVSFISKYDTVLDTLRVCWRNPNNSYNCSECEKCLRTMINLEAVDALKRCNTFQNNIDFKKIKNLRYSNESTRAFILENIHYLIEIGKKPGLLKVLRVAYAKNETRAFLRNIKAQFVDILKN